MNFEVEQYKVTIFEGANPDTLVLMHEDHEEAGQVWELLSEETREKINLAGISGITWEHELSPWEAPALFKKADPFTGGADEYLQKLEKLIIPEIKNRNGRDYRKIYIAGYSLAGLFATYAAIKTENFDGIASASGSLWYPDFLSFVKEHKLSENIKKAYFSVGDKEAKTKNPIMKTVEDNTRTIENLFKMQGLETMFELNQGGHFTEDSKRLAKGIDWLILGFHSSIINLER